MRTIYLTGRTIAFIFMLSIFSFLIGARKGGGVDHNPNLYMAICDASLCPLEP